MGKSVVIHGHFYQPPREDAWTGQVHNLSPDRAWQQNLKKLVKECYAANAGSRVLGADGRINRIINNYSFLSFSYDPWLLNWLKLNAPNVWERIIEGDQNSLGWNNGHGNALAQPWGHTILPLDSPETVKTNLAWGLESFRGHFGREAEGLWLPEMAVNPAVLDEIIAQGVKFILLSPWQAEGLMPVGAGSWTTLGSDPAPSDRPFRLDRPGGSLAVFFHHPGLSNGLAFDHYLRDADLLGNIILKTLETEPGPMTSLVAPGELFGSGEPFGDMCLSALLQKARQSQAFQFTNYGRILELHPPTELVKLRRGEEEKGVSWSCYHGVARWERHCGCADKNQAGWNQAWRTPLRQALLRLKDSLDHLYQEEVPRFSAKDPELLRLEYGRVLSGRVKAQEFCRTNLLPEALEAGPGKLLQLLESQRLAREMFTSSGWFFADPAQEDTIQNLTIAVKAIELVKEFTAHDLLFDLRADLAEIHGNQGSLANTFDQEVLSRRKTAEFPAALFILDSILRNNPSYSDRVGHYKLLSFTRRKTKHSDSLIEFAGDLEVSETNLLETSRYDYSLLEDLQEGVSLFLHPHDQKDLPPAGFDLHRLPMGERQEIVQVMTGDLEDFYLESTQQLLPKLKKSFLYSRLLGIDQSRGVRNLMVTALNRKMATLQPANEHQLSEAQLEDLDKTLHFASDYQLELDPATLSRMLTQMISLEIGGRGAFIEEHIVRYLEKVFALAAKWNIVPDLTVPQILVYEALAKHATPILQELREKRTAGLEKLRCLIHVSGLLGINADALRDEMLSLI